MKKNIIILSDQNFKDQVVNNKEFVLVDFWADWCTPCINISKILEKIAQEYEKKLKIGKLEIDKNPKITMEYNIRSIPTLILFKNGQILKKEVGFLSKNYICNLLNKYLKY
ncbi:MAG: thioredoxin [Arsenophonus sp.]|nr:MAG: thioredoxin [Arsenophonus sp.]